MLELCLSFARSRLLLFASLCHHYPVGRGNKTSLAIIDRGVGRLVLGGDERRELVSGSGGVGCGFILLEQPVSESKNIWQYLVKPLMWGVLGLGIAFAGQAFYIFISGYKDTSLFHSSLTSSLLWNRLLPSPAFPLGILPGIILISLPLWLGLWFALRGRLESFASDSHDQLGFDIVGFVPRMFGGQRQDRRRRGLA